MTASNFIRMSRLFLRQNGRTILTGGSIVLTVLAVTEGIRATCNAKDIIDEKKYEKFEAMGCPDDVAVDCSLTRDEVIKSVWKCYIWTFVLLSAAIGCMVGSHIQSTKAIEGMSVAYTSLLDSYNSYKYNVSKIASKKEQMAINHNTIHDLIESDGEEKQKAIASNNPSIIVSDETSILFRDAYSSKGNGYFKMTMNDARIAIGKFNKWLMDNDKATLNDWYDFLGLGHSEMGDILGWSWMDDGPLYLKAIPDDVNINDDNVIITVLGLASEENSMFFSRPKSIY